MLTLIEEISMAMMTMEEIDREWLEKEEVCLK
jgi:hypothetical protein